MSLMKLRRNRKGFTLIEMMIVIAVIAILAAVIIPKSGLVQKAAKESGVEANMRMVQGQIENLMHRFDGDGEDLATALKSKIGDNITNPIHSGDKVVVGTAAASDTAVSIVYGATPGDLLGDQKDKAGVVHVKIPATYSPSDKITIEGYNASGTHLEGADITLP